LIDSLAELKGKVLDAPKPCHGDISKELIDKLS